MLFVVKVSVIFLRVIKCYFNCYGRLSWERLRRREIRGNMFIVVEGLRWNGGRGIWRV